MVSIRPSLAEASVNDGRRDTILQLVVVDLSSRPIEFRELYRVAEDEDATKNDGAVKVNFTVNATSNGVGHVATVRRLS
jgi:hypothetical protein